MPDAITGAAATPTVDPTTLLGAMPEKPKTGSQAFDKDMFLKLLVAQMKHQNPLNPTDPSDFMAQSAQLAVVEQVSAMTAAQKDAASAAADTAAWQRSLGAATMVGRTVTGTGVDGADVTGVVSSVSISDTGLTLRVGAADVELGSVTSVSA